MVFKTVCGGHEYKWVEKGDRACIKVDDTRLLWWGVASDPRSIPSKDIPLQVLLEFSVQRGVNV